MIFQDCFMNFFYINGFNLHCNHTNIYSYISILRWGVLNRWCKVIQLIHGRARIQTQVWLQIATNCYDIYCVSRHVTMLGEEIKILILCPVSGMFYIYLGFLFSMEDIYFLTQRLGKEYTSLPFLGVVSGFTSFYS